MEYETIEVRGCLACPFSSEDPEGLCSQPVSFGQRARVIDGYWEAVNTDDAFTPSWCPLRTRPTLVQLRAPAVPGKGEV